MALTRGRIAALAVVAAAVAVTVLFPPPPQRLERTGTYQRTAIAVAGHSLRLAREAVAVRLIRDSARRVAGPASGGLEAGPVDERRTLRQRATLPEI